MIREVGSLIGTRVLEFESGDALATVSGAIIHPDTGMLEALWVKPVELMVSNAIIQAADIIEFKKHIYVKSEKVIAPADDVIRISEILSEGRFFLGNHVVSEAGHSYGRCYDMTFDTKTYALKQIYTKKAIMGVFSVDRRIFSYDNIVRVTKDQIIVDDTSEEKEAIIARTPEAAAG